jgi:hypothetical protein
MTEVWPLATVAGLFVWIGCAFLGRWLLGLAGIRTMTLFGGAFVFGYGICGLILQLSLRFIGNHAWAKLVLLLCILAIAGAVGFARRGNRLAGVQAVRPVFASLSQRLNPRLIGVDAISYGLILPWVICVALVYLPVGHFTDTPDYNLPEIFDLPKQLFAQNAAFHATQWPVPNPFYRGESFAYNLLFYLPMAGAAKIAGSELANFQTFSIATIAVAVALPLTLIDFVRAVSSARWAAVNAAILATWAGGLTPLFVKTVPAFGFALFLEKFLQDQVWIDETFLSAIFVPQHIFAVLCALVSTLALVSLREARADWRFILVAGFATLAGALSSLILLPLVVASFALNVGLLFCLRLGRHGFALWREAWPIQSIAAALLPVLTLVPFVLEARSWSSDIGSFLVMPGHPAQWLYVLAALGLLAPMSVVGLIAFLGNRVDSRVGSPMHGLAGVFIVVGVGLGALLFAGYPDAGIKSGLWIRLVLVITAVIGLEFVFSLIGSNAVRRIAATGCIVIYTALAGVNLPLVVYYVQSAYRPLDRGVAALIAEVRNLTPSARLVIVPSDQVLAAMIGRTVDFDVLPQRSDGYLPPASREIVKTFWSGLAANDPAAWQKFVSRYDYAIVARGSFADSRLASELAPIASDSTYLVYRLAGKR